MLTMDTGLAVEFLGRMYPDGPWALTAIAVDKKFIETRTFMPDTESAMFQWIESHNGKRNLYFHVNPVRHPVKSKAERTDIKSVNYLHVDMDAQAGAPLASEIERLLLQLTKKRPVKIPEPTVIVKSGGGVQAFWRLQQPIPINGELGLAEDAKRYNQQLELVFAADNCHNIDRIMRLPGTINIPDAKKLKKGRVEEMARLLQFKSELEYPISDFTQAPIIVVSDKEDSFGGETIYENCKVNISGNVPRLADIDELDQWSVPERVKVICVQGRHPEMPKEGDSSRSGWVFDACCNLVRFGVPDEVIYSIITDPDFGISESILEWKGKAHQYAIRQIEQAKETAVDPILRDMNNRYIVISNLGGKCRIVERIEDSSLHRSRITKQSFEDFRNSWMHIQVPIGADDKGQPKFMPKGQWWLQHSQRKQARTLVFAPNKVVDPKQGYNLWQGFSVVPKPGDCSSLLAHIQNNICNGQKEHYDYLMNWMARAVQQPASPGEVAVVLRGAMGVGKSFLAKVFGHLWGNHYMVVSNSSHLVGNFNAHLRDVCFLFADEAFFAGDKRHRSVLKSLITDQLLPVEAKGVDVEMAPNYLHIMMASNDYHVIPAGEDERRFLVLDVAKYQHQNSAYFSAIQKQLESGGYEAFLHELLTRDITQFNFRDVPKTEALMEQKLFSLTPEQDWWYQKLWHGRILQDQESWEPLVIKDLVIADYVETVRKFNTNQRGSETRLGRLLRKMVPGLTTAQRLATTREHIGDGMFVESKPKRMYHFVFPALDACRKAWTDEFGPHVWPEPVLVDDNQQALASPTDVPF
jgi:hypothetical protein